MFQQRSQRGLFLAPGKKWVCVATFSTTESWTQRGREELFFFHTEKKGGVTAKKLFSATY